MRNTSIDIQKGILTIVMIYGHVLLFFGRPNEYPIVSVLTTGINWIVFPSFLFCFGYTSKMAYLHKPYTAALPGIGKTCLRTLVCFWISGIAFRLLCSHQPFDWTTLRAVLTLSDYPGYSEFLASFAIYSLSVALLFPVYQYIETHPYCFVCSLICVLFCMIPYDRITSPHAGLLIGGTQYAYFPVVQYLPYFLAGIVYSKSNRSANILLAAVAVLGSMCAALWVLLNGCQLPSRFPPHWAWILFPAAGVMVLTIFSDFLDRMPIFSAPPLKKLRSIVAETGSQSLFYLLGSNVCLFALRGATVPPPRI